MLWELGEEMRSFLFCVYVGQTFPGVQWGKEMDNLSPES